MGRVGNKESIDFVQSVVYSSSYSNWTRKKAAEMLAKVKVVKIGYWNYYHRKKVPEAFIQPMVNGVKGAWRKVIYKQALSYLPRSRVIAC